MRLTLDQTRPIYQQIIDDFKRRIARGDLRPGDRIPSQRELAGMIRVNPNTIQRAYREMEVAGLVETWRGQGTFIRGHTDMVATIRREMAQAALLSFVNEMKELGFSPEQVVDLVRQQVKETQTHFGENSEKGGD